MQIRRLGGILVVAAALTATTPAAADVDTTAPSVLPTIPAIVIVSPTLSGVASYRHNAMVLANYSCTDEVGGSGLASCVGTVPVGSALDTSTLGFHNFEIVAEDNAGNVTTFTFGYYVVTPTKVSITSATVVENDDGRQAVKLAVEADSAALVALPFTTQVGTADTSDFTAVSGTLSFHKVVTNRGGTSIVYKLKRVITIPLNPDTAVEGDESFSIRLGPIADPNVPVDIVDDTGTVTILDDDVMSGQRVSVSDVIAREGRTMYFVVSLATPATTTITVPYTVTGVSATGGSAAFVGGDFVTKGPGVLTFTTGRRYKYIAITGRYDTAVEGDETMQVTLGTPTGGAIGYRSTGTGTILDDD